MPDVALGEVEIPVLLGAVCDAILAVLVPFGSSGKELATRRANGGHYCLRVSYRVSFRNTTVL